MRPHYTSCLYGREHEKEEPLFLSYLLDSLNILIDFIKKRNTRFTSIDFAVILYFKVGVQGETRQFNFIWSIRWNQ
jgi:hypothetical protein